MLYVTLATRYNGVYLDCDDDWFDTLDGNMLDEAQGAVCELADYTYEHAKMCEPHLTAAQEQELIRLTREAIKPYLGEVGPIEMKYDFYSS